MLLILMFAGRLLMGRNDEPYGSMEATKHVDFPLWIFIDLQGRFSEIEILGTCALILQA